MAFLFHRIDSTPREFYLILFRLVDAEPYESYEKLTISDVGADIRPKNLIKYDGRQICVV